MKKAMKFLGIIALALIIGFSMAACGGGDDDEDTTPPVTPPPAPTAFEFTLGTAKQSVQVTTIGGAKVNYITGGYEFVYDKDSEPPSQGYQDQWAKFTVDFGADKSIINYDEVTFTMKGTAGDCEWKDVYLLAGVELPAEFEDQAATKAVMISDATFNYTSGSVSVTLTIDKAKVSALDLIGEQELEISIYDHSGKVKADVATKFQITNVKFVAGSGEVAPACCEEDCGCLPFNCSGCDQFGSCCADCEYEEPVCAFCDEEYLQGVAQCTCEIVLGHLASPFQRAGNITVAVLSNGLGVRISESWSGIDFQFQFEEDDVLKIKASAYGTTTGSPELNFGTDDSGGTLVAPIALGGAVSSIIIDAVTLAKITPARGIRFGLNNAGDLEAFVIESLIVERGSDTEFDLTDWITALND